MRAVVATSDHDYFLWQCVVQAYWMQRLGWPVTYLIYTQGPPSLHAQRLARVADVEFWPDWRSGSARKYNPAMKPWLVGRWLERYPQAVDEAVLLMDPDALPTGSHEMPEPADEWWYGTDTDSYTGPGYLRSKGEGLWTGLCAIVGTDPGVAVGKAGIGAQYTFRGQPAEFWEAVALKSIQAYKWMRKTAAQYTPIRPDGSKDYPVQAWCSEMYVLQLEMIRRGVDPVPAFEMEMVWADGPDSDWERVGFFHDAGQVTPNGRDFHKQTYQTSPWGHAIEVHPDSASRRYVELIHEVEREWPRTVW